MTYTQNHIPISQSKRPSVKIHPQYITIHSTANLNSTALNERNWLTNPSNTKTASWHIVVDEKEAIEAIPLNEIAYHAGTSAGNNNSIGIEMCESGNRQKVIENTVRLVANMLYERNWSIERLRRHFDWSGKNCPRILNYDNWQGWEEFKNRVSAELNKLHKEDEELQEAFKMEKRYKKFEELPEWAKPTIKKLMDKKILLGDEKGEIDLSLDMIRMCIFNDRAGNYD